MAVETLLIRPHFQDNFSHDDATKAAVRYLRVRARLEKLCGTLRCGTARKQRIVVLYGVRWAVAKQCNVYRVQPTSY